ncbi:hypothetical protein TREMEDRAFT_26719 [Tremella mesenterica DSM 1558]|uniref:uncharacterized protein n=1 Tax=Tremella mesenterica (strain ATCC 24925 / CBS 8224 / DSM 1558 / NBRC 9311 / NRRL Y-6157 / RJB 2259-6 / UBC 559-6) TaxID=578456 RepID=UPI0003F49C5D|nr:uncharacterized protein TREMEDRAFT_26719 [Tremella mesenterica DSM 1558]EIW72719.1 hypothetical protein TREMEDRAFT_26719 [Tremella mesenterica DSM 1558]
MAPGISYDDSGSLASYFGVTFLAIILLPATYILTAFSDTTKPLCTCSECQDARSRVLQVEKRNRPSRFRRRILPLLLGWTFLAYLCYALATAPRIAGETVYNPFEILGLSDSSSDKQIKKHYKKLSLQFHPDKIKLADNQTKEDADAKFVELTKAYKSLTDEVTRENLAKYGNPDGPQQREDKIAIPQWVVEGKNSIAVLAAYALLLGGGIPYVVGRWWFSQRQLTRDGILNASAETFFLSLREDTDFFSLIALLASAVEFQALLAGKKAGSKKERKERQAKIETLEKAIEAKKEEWDVHQSPLARREGRVQVTSAAARRAQALLWTHLLRMDLSEPELRSEMLSMLQNMPTILNGLLNIALARNWLATSLLAISLQPCLVQALPPDVSPLAQFPDVGPELGQEMQIRLGAEGKRWLEKWHAAKKEEKWVSERTLEVVNRWPRLEVTDVKFTGIPILCFPFPQSCGRILVSGERQITPSAIVKLTWKCRYVYPSTPLTTSTTEKSSNGHMHLNEIIVEKVQKRERSKSDIENSEDKQWSSNGYAHAPRWPQLRKPHYYVLLGDSKNDRVIVAPTKITDIPFPPEDLTQPTESREYNLQFQAPPQANTYTFVAHWRSDTYLGADVAVPIVVSQIFLQVEEPQEDESSEDDISEPDEDTLAGQMTMMRGGKVKASPIHDDDESEYTSSDDEDLGPRRGRAINEDSDSDSD